MNKADVLNLLEKYLAENYVEPEPPPEGVIILHGAKFSVGRTEEKKPDKYDGFKGAIIWQIDKMLDKLELEGTFGQYVRDLIKKKGLTEVEVYKRAQIDRRIFSKIRRYRNYTPSERTIWAICFALELTLDEALELLGRAGYTFSKNNKEDMVIQFFFENKIYDIFLINEILDHYGFKALGDSIL